MRAPHRDDRVGVGSAEQRGRRGREGRGRRARGEQWCEARLRGAPGLLSARCLFTRRGGPGETTVRLQSGRGGKRGRRRP